jgi:hypothetical protein
MGKQGFPGRPAGRPHLAEHVEIYPSPALESWLGDGDGDERSERSVQTPLL